MNLNRRIPLRDDPSRRDAAGQPILFFIKFLIGYIITALIAGLVCLALLLF